MARKLLPCAKCGNKFTTKLIKVYVFKLRHCPKKGCKGEMFTYNDKNIHKCKKCGFTVKFDDQTTLGSMGVAMKGTSRSGKVAETMSREGYEITKVLIPEKRYCQRCLNVSRMINNLVQRETMKRKRINRNIPEDEAEKINREAVHRAVMNKLREQHQQGVEKRKQEGKQKEKSRNPKKFKGAVVSKGGEMCISPFYTVPSKEKPKIEKQTKSEGKKK